MNRLASVGTSGTSLKDGSARSSSGRLSRQSGVPAGGGSTTGGASTTTGSGIGHLIGCEHVPSGIGGADDVGHHVEAATAHGRVGLLLRSVGQHLLEHVGPPARLHEHPVGAGPALQDLSQLRLGLFGGHVCSCKALRRRRSAPIRYSMLVRAIVLL